MRQFIFVIFIILFSIDLFAQDSTQIDVGSRDVINHVSTNVPVDSINKAETSHRISAAPTEQELAELFIFACNGEMNPLDAVDLAVEKGENAVAGLTELLFSQINYSTKPKPADLPDSIIFIAPNRIFPVLALEKISTPGAIAALLRAAESHPNIEIRGIALNSIAKTYNDKIPKEDITPDKVIISVLMGSVEDSTYIGYLQKTTGQIAEEGLLQWLGKDFGELQIDEAKEKVGDKEPVVRMSVSEYRRQWMQENEKNLVWNKEKKKFAVK